MSILHLPASAAPGQGHPLLATAYRNLRQAVTRAFARRATPEPSVAEEARYVRDLAATHQRSDPRFAAELYAAADRHERLHGPG